MECKSLQFEISESFAQKEGIEYRLGESEDLFSNPASSTHPIASKDIIKLTEELKVGYNPIWR